MERRSINSSYGAAYYPWVQIRDDIGGGTLYVPPSVPAIGAMAFSDKQKAVWFAPAGFNRGGLSSGAGGFPVVNVRSKLSSRERDDLYEASINPIASFPSEGIVIFGQKTLQTTPSALDRINVRRLMIFVKKEISNIAANLLFEQNVPETWDRFVSQVEPFLSSVRTGFGLSDFRVVLDETTTTPELVDRNIMYAKIFLKPTRAVEFIAIDFNITNTGASFDD
jgi:phage tail sheath protein FI